MQTPNRFLFFNPELCMGCHACEIACKVEHNLPPGVNRARILIEGPIMIKGKLELHFQRISCLHCANPACLDACPTKAIHKRSDGIVCIEEVLCTGCRTCAAACPHNAIDFNPDKNVVEICDLCANYLDTGQLPFCLKHCMGKALFFGTEKEFEQTKLAINRDRKVYDD